MTGRRKFIGLSLLAFLSACSSSGLNSQDSFSVTLTISAAASLQEAIQDIGDLYSQQMPDIRITYNFGSSGSLQHQIEQGAPVDVFISAASEHMDSLEKQDLLLNNTRQNLLENEVVLITSQGNSDLNNFSQLQSNTVSKIALGDPDSVPAGKYAREVLNYLKLYQSLKSKFVFAKDVRQVLAYVETGNLEAGMVYSTDAQVSERVKIVATAPIDSHAPIIYPAAIIKDSKYPETAQGFIKFLLTDTAKSVFNKYGFNTVDFQ